MAEYFVKTRESQSRSEKLTEEERRTKRMVPEVSCNLFPCSPKTPVLLGQAGVDEPMAPVCGALDIAKARLEVGEKAKGAEPQTREVDTQVGYGFRN